MLKVIATRIFETATAQPTNVLRTVALGSHHLTSNLSVSSNSVHFFVQGQVRVLGMMRKKLQTFQVSMEELRKERTGEVDALGLDLMYDVDQCVRLGAEDEDVHETEGVGEYDSESDE